MKIYKHVLVVGGAGFIGSHVVDDLLKIGISKITVLDNFSRGLRANLSEALISGRVRIFEGDIRDVKTCYQVMDGVDAVMLLAAIPLKDCEQDPQLALKVNIEGTLNIIEATIAHDVRRLIFSSSASVYGNALQTPMSEAHPFNNDTFYGATKVAGEQMLRARAFAHPNLTWVALRYMNAYGPRQDYRGSYTTVIHSIIDRLEAGQAPRIFGDGSQRYDFVSVRDISRANILALNASINREVLNVGTGVATSILELVHVLMNLLDIHSDIEYVPTDFGNLVTDRVGDPRLANELLGFHTNFNLSSGLKQLIDWRRDQMGATVMFEAGS